MAQKTISDFRQDIKSLLDVIHEEEQSTLAIHISDYRIQDLIEEYDENFSSIYINIAQQEVDKFLQS
jgi:acetate kinase